MNMDHLTELTIQDIASGVSRRDGTSHCLVCGAAYEDGAVYDIGGRLYEGWRAALEHLRAEHGSMVRHILETHRAQAGLTEHQAEILTRMAAGASDKAIAEELLGTANTSAIRNLRFQWKEREKQAKLFLALMDAFRTERGQHTGTGKAETSPAASLGAALTDERFETTERERAAVLKTYFSPDGALKEFPVREKRKIIALDVIATRFAPDRVYSEKEVNELIAYRDFATVRRYLIEYGFLERSQDCARYWRKGSKVQ